MREELQAITEKACMELKAKSAVRESKMEAQSTRWANKFLSKLPSTLRKAALKGESDYLIRGLLTNDYKRTTVMDWVKKQGLSCYRPSGNDLLIWWN